MAAGTTLPTNATTEQRNPASSHFDQLSTVEMVRLMNREDAQVPLAVAEAAPQIAQAVDWALSALQNEGRIFYMGAGTSGRLAVLDAAELKPTFSLEPGRVVALLAGGPKAMLNSIENKEDDLGQGRLDLIAETFGAEDLLIAIAASGRTPYALGGLAYADEIGAKSVALVCNRNSSMAAAADLSIEVVTGPEVLTGSTRLKAGTAQKLVLNMISTCTMAKLGKVYGNLMVDVRPTNEKLRDRAARIVREATGLTPDSAQALLAQADWDVKTAVVMGLTSMDVQTARQRLADTQGSIRRTVSAE